jgi:hypothetical protein
MNPALARHPASSSIYSAMLLALIVLAFAMQATFVAAVLGGGPTFLASASALDPAAARPVPCVPVDG